MTKKSNTPPCGSALRYTVTSFLVISGHFHHLNPAKITPGTKLHLYANFQDDRSNGLGANPGQTDRQTLAAYYIDDRSTGLGANPGQTDRHTDKQTNRRKPLII